jgi:hypothetical protein
MIMTKDTLIKDLEVKCDNSELEYLMKEADELVAIFSGIRTMKSKIPNS